MKHGNELLHITLFTETIYRQPQQCMFQMKITIVVLFLPIMMVAGIMVVNTQMAAASDQATVKIHSNTKWSGSVLDSSFDSATHAGSDDQSIPFVCESGIFFGGTYSVVFQKQTDKGGIKISIIQNNVTLDTKATTAPYGVVSLAGNCG